MGAIADHLERVLAAGGNAPAITFDEQILSWSGLAAGAASLISTLSHEKVPGDAAIGLLGRNRLNALAGFVAALTADRGVLLINPMRPCPLIAEELSELKLACVIGDRDDFPVEVLAVLKGLGTLALVVESKNGVLSFRTMSRLGAGPFRARPEGTLIEIQTSGTTGKPKRIPVLERTMMASLRDGVRRAGGSVEQGELVAKMSPTLMFSPLVHTSGTFNTLMALFEVRPIILFEKFDPLAYRDAVVRYRPKFLPLPPTALKMLVDSAATKADFASVIAVRAGTAPLSTDLQQSFEAKFGVPVLTTYGATEFMGAVASWSLDDHRAFSNAKRGSVGRANKGCELRVVDPVDGAPVASGMQGVLEARLDRIDGSAAWIRTTDLARLDDEGFLFIDGRADDAIIRGGFKVMAGKVADILKQAPGVLDAIVLGFPDDRLGEVPMAAVEPYPGTILDEATLKGYAKGKLTAYEVPVRIIVAQRLPRTVSDKISRPDARRLIEDADRLNEKSKRREQGLPPAGRLKEANRAMEPLTLGRYESFYIGGEAREINGANGAETQVIGAMYVHRMSPVVPNGPPVIFVHGGMHTGVTWESTPDGREGWQTLFVRAGFDSYVVDQVFRGRSAPDLNSLNPMIQEYGPLASVFTCGSSLAKAFQRGGGRFDMAWLRDYLPQLWPDFFVPQAMAMGEMGRSDPRALPAMTALVDRVGPCVLVTHSQGGHLGWQTAIARPEKIAAIYAIEPGTLTPGLDDPGFPDIPVQILWGDHLPKDGPVLSMRQLAEARAFAEQRPKIEVDHLPERGIAGNGHMLMMESNSAELARQAVAWIRHAVR